MNHLLAFYLLIKRGLVIICKPGADKFGYNDLKNHAEDELRKLDKLT